jgi:hypothetical protein
MGITFVVLLVLKSGNLGKGGSRQSRSPHVEFDLGWLQFIFVDITCMDSGVEDLKSFNSQHWSSFE